MTNISKKKQNYSR